MKRLLTLTLALLMVVTLMSVGPVARAEEEDPYVGLWEITGQQDGDTYSAYAESGIRAFLDFMPNGAIYAVMTDGGESEEDYLAYQVTGENTLDLYEGEDSLPGVYDPATGIITITEPGSGFISFVERVKDDPLPDIRAMVDKSEEELTYYGYSMTEKGQTIDMLQMLPPMGMDPRDFYLILSPDGTGEMQFGSEEASGDITWSETELTSDGSSVPYTREGDHIVIQISDDTFLEMAPEGEVEALMAMLGIEIAEPTEAVDMDPADLVGQWQLSKAIYSGQTLTVQEIKDLGLEMSFTFNADGTASMVSNGSAVEDLDWDLEDGVVSLSFMSYEVFTLSYDGEYLVLDMMAQIYFEKVG